MTPMDCCKMFLRTLIFTTDDITSKFELFSKNKMNDLYLTESMHIDGLHILDEY